MTIVANYGRPDGTREDPGGMGGANKARDQWWAGQGKNDQQQNWTQAGGNFASEQAALGQNRGATAQQDATLAANANSGAGGHQQGAIGYADQLARGNTPSAAAYQLQSGLNQATDQQASMAAGARGGAALATAGANQQANTAALQQNAFTQGGLLRSRDMASGRGLLGSALAQQRDNAGQLMGQANQLNQFIAKRNDDFSLQMGQAGVAFGDVANQQGAQDLAWYQGGMRPINAQSEAEQQGQEWDADAEKQRIAAAQEDG